MMAEPSSKKRKAESRFQPTQEMLDRAAIMAPAVLAFDWKTVCRPGQTEKKAKQEHLEWLVRSYGETFSSYREYKTGTRTPMPSKQQIYILPIFTDPVVGPKNIACISESYRPAVFQSKQKKEQKKIAAQVDYSKNAHKSCSKCYRRFDELVVFHDKTKR